MSSITVTAAQLKSTAEQLEGLNNQFKSAVSNLESQEQSLCSMWEGEAKNSFDAAFKRDKNNMDLFNANIMKYVAALRTIAAKYEQAEQTNVSTANQRSY